jgi:rubrerythrin
MTKWVCARCNYRFESNSYNECPYCGKIDRVEKELSATELLNEIEKVLEG